MSSSILTTCTVPVTSLRASPYSLEWGSSVFAKVIAVNIYGNSIESTDGNGAVITTSPDAPINLAEVVVDRTKSTLGLSWDPAAFTGGDVIIDYRISIAEQGQTFSVLASGVTESTYTATGLNFGTTYEFKVESRNSYGYSAFSSTETLLCAFIADPPTTVTTVNADEKVTITWNDPIANGSPITAYKIYIIDSTSAYVEESVECDGTSSTVITNRECQVALSTLTSVPYSLI